jgi:hypothetical protein
MTAASTMQPRLELLQRLHCAAFEADAVPRVNLKVSRILPPIDPPVWTGRHRRRLTRQGANYQVKQERWVEWLAQKWTNRHFVWRERARDEYEWHCV